MQSNSACRGFDTVEHRRRAGPAIAYGSLSEVETQLVIAERLKYIDSASLGDMLNKTAEVGRLINGLSGAIQRKHGLTTDH